MFIIHTFSGLETSFYVWLLSALFVTLDRSDFKCSIMLTLALFLTRPESWLLALLVPIYILIPERIGSEHPAASSIPAERWNRSRVQTAALAAFALVVPLGIFLLVNRMYFSYALPTSFYLKSGAPFSLTRFGNYFVFILLLVLLLLARKTKLFIIMSVFMIAVALMYSQARLEMDYAGRFTFHIFVPIFVILVYSSATNHSDAVGISVDSRPLLTTSYGAIAKSVSIVGLLLFWGASSLISLRSGTQAITSYPHALRSAAAFGQTLSSISKRYGVRAFSFGEAGISAYLSDMNALDNTGLGSSLVAHEGVTPELLQRYEVDLIVLHAKPDGIVLGAEHQREILTWAEANNFRYLCSLYFDSGLNGPADELRPIYSRKEIPELRDVCVKSESQSRTRIDNRSYIRATWTTPPWHYWVSHQ